MARKITVSEEVKKKMESRKGGNMQEEKLEEAFSLEDVFNDTCRQCEENETLNEYVKNSIACQLIIRNDTTFMARKEREGKVIVTRKKTFEAAAEYARRGQTVAVLNFGSAFVPGGGGHKNALTQEECLCRESTLYPCISHNMCMEQFYQYHRDYFDSYGHIGRPYDLYNDDMIYTPHVMVFKTSDKFPVLMPEKEWFDVDVITMAAPNIKGEPSAKSEPMVSTLVNIFEDRFSRVMISALQHKVDVLILGAFGCGDFGNDPMVVATGAARALEKFRDAFDTVEFAVYETGRKKCFHAFRMVLDRYLNESQT